MTRPGSHRTPCKGSKQEEEDATSMAPRLSYKNPSMDLHRLGGQLLPRRDPGTQHWSSRQKHRQSARLGDTLQESASISGTSTLLHATRSDQQAQESDGRAGSQYLDEVGVEPSHKDPLDEFFLFTVLVTYRRWHGTVRRGRHQEGFVEVLRELLDKAYREETVPVNEIHPLLCPAE